MSGHPGMMRDLNSTGLNRSLADHERDVASEQAGILRDAVKGDAMARFVARKVLNITGWYSREHGNIIGDLTQVVAELEARGVPRFSWQLSPLRRVAKRVGMRGG